MLIRKRVVTETDPVEVQEAVDVVSPLASLRLAWVVRLCSIIYFAASLVSLVILLRFFMVLLGVSMAGGFANFVDSLSGPLVAPFAGLVNNVHTSVGALEWNDVIALVVYWVAAGLAAKATSVVLAPSRSMIVQHQA